MDFFDFLQQNGLLGPNEDLDYYREGGGADAEAFDNLFTKVNERVQERFGSESIFHLMQEHGKIGPNEKPGYYLTDINPIDNLGEFQNFINAVSGRDLTTITLTPGGGAASDGTAGGGSDVPEGFDPDAFREPIEVAENVTIPPGGTLIRVAGIGESPDEYYLRLPIGFGVNATFRIGDQERFDDMFPEGRSSFDSFESTTTVQFQGSDDFRFLAGDIDEVVNMAEPLATSIQRDMAMLGLEGPPPWMANDPQAMLLMVTSNREDWSAERRALELSRTDGFIQRHSGWAGIAARTGTTDVLANLDFYYQEERAIRAAIQTNRGPQADASNDFIGTLLNTGWTSGEVTELLEAEKYVYDNPEWLDYANQVLAANDMGQIDENGLVDLITGNTDAFAPEVFAAVSEVFQAQALAEQGIEIDAVLAAELGQEVADAIAGPGAFDQTARDIAVAIGQNVNEIALGQYGITRDDLIRGLARNEGDTLNLLAKLARERREAGQGIEGPGGFIDRRNRVRIPGGFSA